MLKFPVPSTCKIMTKSITVTVNVHCRNLQWYIVERWEEFMNWWPWPILMVTAVLLNVTFDQYSVLIKLERNSRFELTLYIVSLWHNEQKWQMFYDHDLIFKTEWMVEQKYKIEKRRTNDSNSPSRKTDRHRQMGRQQSKNWPLRLCDNLLYTVHWYVVCWFLTSPITPSIQIA